ncbi:TonB-dependent receptor [Sphingomonas spermidinifaciens]|uniref:TonB-dependent receptor n=1 Tax=Sphingomonas spermidinifaciens TaxID=1141889 RepID=A0A2A4B7B9_9SPHN|nr:TonB-dependent receptor [Sphingomonas spermidinifaciens]PCD03658.1 TonB-dependent receptor [Sphingomonas spermidinifaciens]
MIAKGFMIGVSGYAIALAGAGLAQPAYAQDAGQAAAPEAASEEEGAQEILVTARRKALNDAIEIKRNADTIVDSIVADQAGRLPDTSITEVLQRVPGIALSRFSVDQGNPSFQIEGTGISVRGLPYNSSTLNGRQVFSANGGSAISWGDVTPELMSAVNVYKGTTASLIEGGASQVDLRTRLPFDYSKSESNLTVGGSYGDMSKKFSPNISALYTKSWTTGVGEIGILWNLAFSRFDAQSSDLKMNPFYAAYAPGAPDDVGLIPYGYNWSNSEFRRDRYGLYQAVQWKPDPDIVLTNTLFYSQYNVESMGSSAGFGMAPNQASAYIPVDPVFDENGAMIAGSLRYGATGNIVYGAGGNTWLQQYSGGWSPAPDLDCGSQAGYGGPVSQATADWSNGVYGCTEPLTNIQGFGSSRSVGKSKSSTLDLTTSFVWTPARELRISGGIQYVRSIVKSTNMFASLQQTDPALSSASFDLRNDIPVVGGFDAAALANTDTAYWGSMAYNGADNKGTMFASNIDVDYSFGDDSFFKSVSVGARASVRNENDNFIGTYWAPLAQPWAGIQYFLTGPEASPNGSPDDYEVYDFPGFFGGRVPSPGAVLIPSERTMKSFDWYRLQKAYNGAIPNGTREDYWQEYFQNPGGLTDSRIANLAGYIQLKFGRDRGEGGLPFSGNIGVRVVRAQNKSSGLLVQNQVSDFFLSEADAAEQTQIQFNGGTPDPAKIFSTLPSATPRSIDYSFTRVLPSLNLRFDVSPQIIVRVAASEGLAPPDLNAIRAGGNIGASTRSVSFIPPGGGDPLSQPILTNFTNQSAGARLDPVRIRSEDLSFEWYPRNGTAFNVSLFAKQIRDQEVFTFFTQNQQTPIVNGNGEIVTIDIPWTYLQNETSDEQANIKGFEIGGRTFFDKLPGLLSGFGVNGSFNFVDSSNPAPQATDVLGNDFEDLPFFNLSKYSYNAELLYSRKSVNFRIAYNWRSKQLLSTNANPLSYATSGGNPYWANLSPTDFGPEKSFQVYNMVPLWAAPAGYVDIGFDYRFNNVATLNLMFGNVTNTKSRTYQEPLPGVMVPYDTNISDRRVTLMFRTRL